jgi:TonB-linked SusC/RagA family outer membrane protein
MKKKWFLKDYSYLFNSCRKIVKIMRLSVFLIILTSLQSIALDSFPQRLKFNVNIENESLSNALKLIERESGYFLFYNNKVINLEKVVSLNLTNKSVTEVLEELFEGTDVTYTIIGDKQIVLSKKSGETKLSQQQKNVSGKVTDFGGQPLPGVTVVVKGTTQGTVTNANGEYSITNIPEDATLLFSFVGMRTQEILLEGRATISVVMEEETIGLDEVVAVGYGTMKKSDISTSISSVDSEALSKIPSNDLAGSIAGRIPGVYVTGVTGGPGSGSSVRIRGVGTTGSNEPLYVVDGFPISSGNIGIPGSSESIGGLSVINPNDIESIDILKDASAAAIYGARAANGVVLITTKKGTYNAEKTVVNVNTYTGFSQVWKQPESLTAEEFAMLANELTDNSGMERFPGLENPESLGKGTNWFDAVFQSGPVTNIDASISGGSKSTRARLSLGYKDEVGTIIETDYKRYTGKASVDFIANDRMEFGGAFDFAWSEGKGVQNESGNFGIVNLAQKMFPTLGTDDILDKNVPYSTSQADNPVLKAKHEDKRVDNLRTHIVGYGQYEILKGLKFRTNLGLEFNSNRQTQWIPSFDRGYASNAEANLWENFSRGRNYLIENTLSYSNEFEKHQFNIVIGQTAQENTNAYNNIQGRDYLNEAIPVINGSDASRRLSSGSEYEYRLASYLGRINYNYGNKYLVSVSIRRDGSSNFGPRNKWGLFPSLSTGWNIANENFMQNIQSVTTLKLRGGWGRLGNDNIGSFGYLNIYQLGASSNNYTLGLTEALQIGAALSRPANPDLKWETNEQINFGIDASFFKNKLYTTIEYYNKKTKDLLVTIPVAIEAGFTSNPKVNGGEILNRGWEFDLGFRDQAGSLAWSVSANISTLYNEVLSLGGGEPIAGQSMYSSGMANTWTEVGDEIGYFRGYINDGIYQTENEIKPSFQPNAEPGDLRWRDVDKDGYLTENDIVKLGSPWPDFTYGGNIDLSFKGFDFNLILTGVAGNQIFNSMKKELLPLKYYGGGGLMSGSKEVLQRWTPGSGRNTVPKLKYSDENNNMNTSSSWFIEDGDFMRIRSITIGYTIPQTIVQAINMSSLRVYINAKNLLTLTKYSGLDPEVRSTNPLAAGMDYGVYPQPRTFIAGINISF